MQHAMLRAAVLTASVLVAPVSLVAQAAVESGGFHASRGDLEARVRRLEDLAQSAAVRDVEREQARVQLAALRSRLDDGDFRFGDRIAVRIDDHAAARAAVGAFGRTLEEQLSDTFSVGSARELSLPVVGTISLRGVLRSELEDHLTKEVGRYIRQPVLRASSLIRVSIQGSVARPGYYSLPTGSSLSDALMAAGGTAPTAKIAKLRIDRDGRPFMEGDPLQRAIAEGRTFEEVDLRGGDQFVVPDRRGSAETTLKIIGVALSIPVTIFTLIRIM